MDRSGRVVVPKEVREQAQIKPGMSLEISVRKGRILIEPVPFAVEIRREGQLMVAAPREAAPPLTAETVEKTRHRVRRSLA